MEKDYYIDGNFICFKSGFDGIFTEKICENINGYDKITIIRTTNKFINLPKHIKSIEIHNYNFPVDNLHDGLLELSFYDFYNFPLDNLPLTLKKIQVPFDYKYPLDFLPDGLECLDLFNNYALSLKNLPSSINEIKIIYGLNDNFVMIKDMKGINKILPNLKTIKLKSPQKVSLEEIKKQIKLGKEVELKYYCILEDFK